MTSCYLCSNIVPCINLFFSTTNFFKFIIQPFYLFTFFYRIFLTYTTFATSTAHTSNDYQAKAGIFKPKTYIAVTQNLEPTSVKATLQDSKWYLAMNEEFKAVQRNSTWTLVPPYAAAKIVGNKWVYRVKYNLDESISKYKAHLVAKGYH